MVDLLILGMMGWNCLVALSWALGALRIALRESLWQWPVPWRYLVFLWMFTKAILFLTLEAALGWHVPMWVAVVVVVEFTVAHTWAWWRWRYLPDLGAQREGLGGR